MQTPRTKTLVVAALAVALALPAAAGCSTSGNGAQTNCTTSACTIVFDQGVNAEASILGVSAKLISVQGQQVTLEVAGQRINLAANQPVQVGGFEVALQSVANNKVTVKVSQGTGEGGQNGGGNGGGGTGDGGGAGDGGAGDGGSGDGGGEGEGGN